MVACTIYSAKAVANYLLAIASTIDHLTMHKLVYFAHGWHLALRDAPLMRDSVEAWDHGPVIPDLYHEFKRWGSGPIRQPATTVDRSGRGLIIPSLDAECVWESDPDDAKKIIAKIWDVYGKYDGLQLSAMTHRPGTPWAAIKALHPGKRDIDIPDELIQQFFKNLMHQNADATAEAS